MNTSTNDGGPAFPSLNSEMTGIDSNGVERFDTEESGGMSLRDYFAAKAMQSVLDGSWPDLQLVPQSGLEPIENSAMFAYQIADAMIQARSATV